MALATKRIEPDAAFAAIFAEQGTKLPGWRHEGLADLRRLRLERFMTDGFPTAKVEAWKYTNVAKVANRAMRLAPQAEVALSQLSAHFAGGPAARRLIFVNGHVSRELSHVGQLPEGLTVMSLHRALEERPDEVAAALSGLDDARSLTALNAAFAAPGAWIEVAAGAQIGIPVQVIYATVGQTSPVMTHPRNIVRLGEGARLRLIESHISFGAGPFLTNLVNEMRLGAGAALEHDRIELGRDGTTLIGNAAIELADRAQLTQTVVSLGGDLTRNESEVRLKGSNIECVLNGLYAPRGREHVDNQIRIHHEAPDSHSDQFFKGIMDERGHGVFAGKIFVEKAAQRTNAYQKNDNLLLSDEAEIDTKPELEIYADDVKCSHGATVGDLDEKALFYLRSRGLDPATARSILTFAFAAEVIGRFSDPVMRRLARQAVAARLPGGEVLKGLE